MRASRLASAGRLLIASVLIVAAVIHRDDPAKMSLIWGTGVVPAAYLLRFLRAHLQFTILIVGPVAILSAVLWGGVAGGTPTQPDAGLAAGLEYAGAVALRLLLFGGAFQLFTIAGGRQCIGHNLRALGLSGGIVSAAVGVASIMPEVERRAAELYEARLARGLTRRGLVSRLRAVAGIFRPLVGTVIRDAMRRGDSWDQRNSLELVVSAEFGAPDGDSMRTTLALSLLMVPLAVVLSGA